MNESLKFSVTINEGRDITDADIEVLYRIVKKINKCFLKNHFNQEFKISTLNNAGSIILEANKELDWSVKKPTLYKYELAINKIKTELPKEISSEIKKTKVDAIVDVECFYNTKDNKKTDFFKLENVTSNKIKKIDLFREYGKEAVSMVNKDIEIYSINLDKTFMANFDEYGEILCECINDNIRNLVLEKIDKSFIKRCNFFANIEIHYQYAVPKKIVINDILNNNHYRNIDEFISSKLKN